MITIKKNEGALITIKKKGSALHYASFRISDEHHEKLRKISEESGRTMSGIVSMLIERAQVEK